MLPSGYLRRRLPDPSSERGFALAFALLTCIVLTISTVSVVTYTSAGSRSANVSRTQLAATALAEAGINDASSILNSSSNTASDPTLLQTARTVTLNGGTVTFSGVWNSATSTWTVTSTGDMTNPTGAADVKHTITAQIPVTLTTTQTLNVSAWNWILATKTSNSSTCDSTIGESSIVDTPVYVFGNLCIDKQAYVYENPGYNPPRPVNLTVLGKTAFIGDFSGHIGCNTSLTGCGANQSITEAHLVGGCIAQVAPLTSATHTCDPNGPYHDHVWANTLNQTAASVTAPVASFTTYYNSASPGPKHACTTSSGTVPVWDNAVGANEPDNSAPSFELTPSASDYSCVTKDGSGNVIGQLSWNHTTRVLTIAGDIYIDGSATVSDLASGIGMNTYTGSGALYLSGTFSMIKGAYLCALQNATDCDWGNWNPNSSMLAIITNGSTAAPDGTASGVILNESNQLQAALYATNSLYLGKSGRSEGPMVAGSIDMQKPFTAKPFPTITTVPPGMPTVTNAHAQPGQPSYTAG